MNDLVMGSSSLALTHLNPSSVVPSTTGAGSAHSHGVTDPGHGHGGLTTAAGTANPTHFGALAAPGVAYHAPFMGGDGPINTGPVGVFARFYHRRGVQVTGSPGCAAGNVTIHMQDAPGNVYSTTIAFPGGAVTVMDPNPVVGDIIQVTTDFDPGGMADLLTIETNQDFGPGTELTPAALGVDGAVETIVNTHGNTGGVRPTTTPDGTHVYDVLYTAAHTHGVSTNSDTTGITLATESAHTHSI